MRRDAALNARLLSMGAAGAGQRSCGAAALAGGRASVSWCPTVSGLLGGAGDAPNQAPYAGARGRGAVRTVAFLAATLGLSGLSNRNTREYLKMCAPGIGNTSVSGGTAKATCSGQATVAAAARSNVWDIANLAPEPKDSIPKLAGLGAARAGGRPSWPTRSIRGHIFRSGAQRLA